jgi:16S rRNA G966 N2-methylase RsmD
MDDKRGFLFRYISLEKRLLLLLDNEALYSVTDQHTANKISKYIHKHLPNVKTITDGTACIGGNTYSFSRYFENVYAIEIDPTRFSYLQHNLRILEINNNTIIFNDNVLNICRYLHQDMIFLDPPWGGPNYKSITHMDLYLSNIELSDVCKMLSPYTKYISIKVPTNFNIESFNIKTRNHLTLLYRNIDLRKMNLLIYMVI